MGEKQPTYYTNSVLYRKDNNTECEVVPDFRGNPVEADAADIINFKFNISNNDFDLIVCISIAAGKGGISNHIINNSAKYFTLTETSIAATSSNGGRGIGLLGEDWQEGNNTLDKYPRDVFYDGHDTVNLCSRSISGGVPINGGDLRDNFSFDLNNYPDIFPGVDEDADLDINLKRLRADLLKVDHDLGIDQEHKSALHLLQNIFENSTFINNLKNNTTEIINLINNDQEAIRLLKI